jgi:cytochrome c-type biogenesis protein CcmH
MRLPRILLVAVAAAGAAMAQPPAPHPAPASTPARGAAQDSAIEATTRALALELRCPVCQGLSIGDSPSELAQEMRGVIRDQLRAGRTPDEVRQYFVQKYGEWILLAPEPRGFNLFVYVIPLLFLAFGGWVVWRFIRRWSAPPPGSPAAPDVPANP